VAVMVAAVVEFWAEARTALWGLFGEGPCPVARGGLCNPCPLPSNQ
jgi:hypothetical protein